MPAPGDPAPDFSLARLDGSDWRLEEETAEGPLLLTFIETDCPTCRLVVPYLKRLAEALGPNGHRVVVVSQDGGQETRELVEAYDVSFPVLLDVDLDVSRSYDPPSVPALFLVRKGGGGSSFPRWASTRGTSTRWQKKCSRIWDSPCGRWRISTMGLP